MRDISSTLRKISNVKRSYIDKGGNPQHLRKAPMKKIRNTAGNRDNEDQRCFIIECKESEKKEGKGRGFGKVEGKKGRVEDDLY